MAGSRTPISSPRIPRSEVGRENAARPLYIGPRLRRLRRELGLTQQAMAEDLAISPSYVALIERNQRPVTADLLLRIARAYRLELSDLAVDESADYARRISDALRDPIFAEIDLPAMEVADLAASFPGISEALLRLYGAYARAQSALAELSGGEDADGTGGASAAKPDPVAELRRFLAAQRNHFPALELRAEALVAAIAEAGDARAYLAARHGIRARQMPAYVMMGMQRRFDRHRQELLLDDTLAEPSVAFQLVLQIVQSECRAEIAGIARAAGFATPAALTLARRALADYLAAAILMPYERFARAANERAGDVEALARLFDTSFEQTAHRLTTLQRPGAEGVAFFFVRIDAAGNVSKRLDGAGFPFAGHGGGCPLWNVHTAFARRGEVLTQWLELPDGRRFFSLARTVSTGTGGYGAPRATRSVALVCAAEDAPRLVYARGVDPRQVAADPVGVSCRLCPRPDCVARALPPIGREIVGDDNRRGFAPFTFAET